jgi:hypothetical protein
MGAFFDGGSHERPTTWKIQQHPPVETGSAGLPLGRDRAFQAGNEPVGDKWFQAVRTHPNEYNHFKTLVGTLIGYAPEFAPETRTSDVSTTEEGRLPS